MDRSGRWYLTPGARSIYDLRVRNDSKNAVDCSLIVEEPAIGVSVEPASFSLRGHEVRTVTVTFSPEATSVRSHRVVVSLRSEEDSSVLATFEHPLVITGGTDCSVAVAWKDVIVEAGELRGFEVACSVRSQSESTSTFQLSLSTHPAFSIPPLPPISLEPGQLGEMIIPIQWDRDIKDEGGWNHPLMIEVAVPVSNGRRTSKMRWESIELKLDPFLKKNSAPTMGVTVSSGASAAIEPQAPAQPSSDQAEAQPVRDTPSPQPVAPAQPVSSQPPAATSIQIPPSPGAVTSPVSPMAPAAAAASVGPVVEAAAAPSTPVKEPTAAPSATAVKSSPQATAEPKTAPKEPQVSKAVVATAAPTMLMLNGHTQLLMLAAPADVRPAAVAASPNGAVNGKAEATRLVSPAATVSSEPVELSLFPGIVATSTPAVAPGVNGKHEVPVQPAATSTTAPTPPIAPPAELSKSSQAPVGASQPAAPPAEASKTAQAPFSAPQSAPSPAEASKPAATPFAAQSVAPQPTPAPAPAPFIAPPRPPVAAPESSKGVDAPQVSTLAPQAAAPAAAPAGTAEAKSPSTGGEQPKVAPPKPAPTVTWTVKSSSIEEPKAKPATTAAASAAVAAVSTQASAAQAAAAQTPAAPPAKLTPYTPAKWDAKAVDAPPSPTVAPKLVEPVAAPAVAQPAPRVVRERLAVEPTRHSRPMPAGLFIGGLAGIALVVAGVLIFKPTTPAPVASAVPVAAQPTAQAQQQHVATVVHPHEAARPVAKSKVVAMIPSPRPTATATAAPTQTPKPATPKPATPKPAAATPTKPVAQWAVQHPAPKPVSHYATLYQPASGSVVALGSVEAYYGPRGRAVRVLWGAAEQAGATVQLIDEHGMTVSQTSVRGGRTSALLYLPKGFRGPLTVQVSSIGRMGERVATTTSLDTFGR